MTHKSNNAGTWFLSYLCELGIIQNDCTVEGNYVTGKLLKTFWNIPANYLVYIQMVDGVTLDIAYAPCEIDNENVSEYEDDICWLDKEGVQKKTVKAFFFKRREMLNFLHDDEITFAQ